MRPKRSWNDGWTLVKRAVSSWSDDRAPSMGAALSYYTVFSLAPLLLIVISIAGLVFGGEAVRGELFGELRGLMGDGAAEAVEALVAKASRLVRGLRRGRQRFMGAARRAAKGLGLARRAAGQQAQVCALRRPVSPRRPSRSPSGADP